MSTVNVVKLLSSGQTEVLNANARITQNGLTLHENISYFWDTKVQAEECIRQTNPDIEFGGFIRDDNESHRFESFRGNEVELRRKCNEINRSIHRTDIFHDIGNCISIFFCDQREIIFNQENLLSYEACQKFFQIGVP